MIASTASGLSLERRSLNKSLTPEKSLSTETCVVGRAERRTEASLRIGGQFSGREPHVRTISKECPFCLLQRAQFFGPMRKFFWSALFDARRTFLKLTLNTAECDKTGAIPFLSPTCGTCHSQHFSPTVPCYLKFDI